MAQSKIRGRGRAFFHFERLPHPFANGSGFGYVRWAYSALLEKNWKKCHGRGVGGGGRDGWVVRETLLLWGVCQSVKMVLDSNIMLDIMSEAFESLIAVYMGNVDDLVLSNVTIIG